MERTPRSHFTINGQHTMMRLNTPHPQCKRSSAVMLYDTTCQDLSWLGSEMAADPEADQASPKARPKSDADQRKDYQKG